RSDIKVTEIEKDILKIEYPHGKVMYKNIGNYQPPTTNSQQPMYSPTYDSTIIDLTTIDTTLYYQKYSFLQEVGVGTDNTKPPLVGDVNNNGLPEIYGQMKDYNTGFSDLIIMEKNSPGGYDSVYIYDSTSSARTIIYDIDKDGSVELYLHRFPQDTNYTGHSWLVFKKPFDTSFATQLSFVFHPLDGSQINGNTFGDWDGDALTDQIFIRPCCPPTINIFEYNPLINNFDSVYQFDFSSLDNFYHGFIIGDFDQDSNTEFFAGSVNGKVIAIENCGDNCYNFIWQGSVETNNAYLYAVTNDLDGNGKPELWIGGYHFWNGEAITRITIFEASGNNNYVAVGKIDIIGAFNFYAKNMQVLDVDKDGKEEVMMCIEQHVLILKFSGSQNHHTYEVFYIKRNDLAFSGRNSVFYGATMYDVTGDGKEDIVIHLDDIITNVGMRLFTFIYKADFSVDVNEPEPLPEKFHLYPNYPNPFNPVTTIKYDIVKAQDVKVTVLDILGSEIATLVNELQQPGSYEIKWDASNVSSGIYIYQLKTKDFVSTKKMILIK
ncbi:MAG TPA: T9SS type A sorting domain-containing protein, partial [Ignavibacteriaceae bacterium]|nr:T9SS type A sorting domain-containing protein [Ignavibacteriaceae bacterium]